MVLQYKGYNNNWFYEEAEQIGFAAVYLGDIIESTLNEKCDNLSLRQSLVNAIKNYIENETHCESPKFIIGDINLEDLKNVYVVMLTGENKDVSYIFTNGVYLLNNSGKTIQKIC